MTFSSFVGESRPNSVQVADVDSIQLDASIGNFYQITLHGNRSLVAPVRSIDGKTLVIAITQDNVGNRLLDLATGPGGFAFGTDLPTITLSTAPNMTDYLTVTFSANHNRWHVIRFIRGFAE